MKCLLISTLLVLSVAGVFGIKTKVKPDSTHVKLDSTHVKFDPFAPIRQKQIIHEKLVKLLDGVTQDGISAFCKRPLTPEQILLGTHKLDEFVHCGNLTIDKFISKLGVNVNFNNVDSIVEMIRFFSEPMCEVWPDIFGCLGPVLEVCLSDQEKTLKSKIFSTMTLVNQALCVRTGHLIADIFLHPQGISCIAKTAASMKYFDYYGLFESDSTTLFGNENECRKGLEVLHEIYTKVGECSVEVLAIVKDMLGFICERTHCIEYIPDLNCY